MEQKNVWRIVAISTTILLLIVLGYVIYNSVQTKFYVQGYEQGKLDSTIQIGIEQSRTGTILWWDGQNVTVVPIVSLCGERE